MLLGRLDADEKALRIVVLDRFKRDDSSPSGLIVGVHTHENHVGFV